MLIGVIVQSQRGRTVLLAAAALIGVLCVLQNSDGPGAAAAAPLVRQGGPHYSIEVPQGWRVTTGGHCLTFSVVARDPSEPARQVFYFSSVGPFTLSQRQHQMDLWYMRSGGFPVQWAQFPVIEPMTTTNFIAHWNGFAQSAIGREFMSGMPQLANIQILNSDPVATQLAFASKSELVRAVFREGNSAADGYFSAALAQIVPFMNGPGGHTGRAYNFTGVSAPAGRLGKELPALLAISSSLQVSDGYIANCIRENNQEYAGVRKAGETLRQTSEIITRGFEGRQRIDDVRAMKYADMTRGVERLYDPDTREVFEFPRGFEEEYERNPNAYNRAELQPLPDNAYDLWEAPARDGTHNVFRQ
jgi:hypothetical protein